MKNICLILVIAFLSSCNHKAEQTEASTKQKSLTMDVNMLASKKDYACGMTLDKESLADTASYNGKIYGFCSKECKAEFLKNPQSYLSK